jgi:pyrroloquinoline quinone (PQQ) biosynthesis protein C
MRMKDQELITSKLSAGEFEERFYKTAGFYRWENQTAMIQYARGPNPTRHGMQAYALEHCVFAANFPRWFGNIVANCPNLAVRQYLIGNMYVEEVEDPTIKNGHYESLVDFAVALGLDRQAVYDYQPSMHMLTGLHYWDNVSRTKSWLEGFAAIGGIEFQNSGRLAKRHGTVPFNSRASFAKLNLSEKSLSHFEAGESADHGEGGHGDETIKILVEHAKTAEQQQAVISIFEESIAVFWHVYNNIGMMARDRDRKLGA